MSMCTIHARHSTVLTLLVALSRPFGTPLEHCGANGYYVSLPRPFIIIIIIIRGRGKVLRSHWAKTGEPKEKTLKRRETQRDDAALSGSIGQTA